MQRIAIDVRQERERANMRIRHRLEDGPSEPVPAAELEALEAIVSLTAPEDRPAAAALGVALPEARAFPQSLTRHGNRRSPLRLGASGLPQRGNGATGGAPQGKTFPSQLLCSSALSEVGANCPRGPQQSDRILFQPPNGENHSS